MTVDRASDRVLVEKCLETLGLEQKVRLLTGADFWTTHAEPAIGLRALVFSDGPAGVRGTRWDEREPSLNLPSATALAAGWDRDLAYRYGAALATEARRKGVDVVLGPTINLQRSPLGGRGFEAFSEDPLLTGELASAYVRGLQEHGVAASPKHYVANDFETERFTASVEVDDRTLRELYLAPFEQVVTEAGAWLVMSAYNSVRGTTMTEHPLLRTPLCTEWGFDGVVVSDWTAVRDTEASARARQDLAMPGPASPWGEALVTAVREGRVPEEAVDEKVRRLLRLAARVGALDGAAPRATVPPPPVDRGAALARQVASAGVVLLRNDGVLPWPAGGPRSIAVIGEHAALPRTQGGGSATVLPERVATPLDGLRAALPDASVTWSAGVPLHDGLVPLPLGALTDPHSVEPGLRVRYLDTDGEVLLSENRRAAELVWLGTLPAGTATLELRTRYRPDAAPVAGETSAAGPVSAPGKAPGAGLAAGSPTLGVAAAGELRILLDGDPVFDADLAPEGTSLGAALFGPPVARVPVEPAGDRPVLLTVRYRLPESVRVRRVASITLGTEPADRSVPDAIAAAAACAGAAEMAVVVVGTTPKLESEGFDRAGLALPGAQDDLVRAVAAANPRTVVVVNSGGPVLLPWRDEVAAVLVSWFGGQEFGAALADVLLGRAEPGGRLPMTWPAAEADVPVLNTRPADGVLHYDEGVHIGYRAWLRAGRAPAYPFGHGLGYTSWELADLVVAAPDSGEPATVTVTVHNTGRRAGRQVVQAYLSRPGSTVDRPVRWLAGFASVHAEPGTRHEVSIPLPARAFEHWDAGWRTEPGRFTVHVGTDAEHLPLHAPLDRTSPLRDHQDVKAV
ncbi:MAG TPA: glycoside hydrolase family 3 C-terminal domain-containing protein [Pseudonocardia sp.]|nr:glycoside hydrolase family 3 C-terminal domain-containing protein [Pseudonocardia sp.]